MNCRDDIDLFFADRSQVLCISIQRLTFNHSSTINNTIDSYLISSFQSRDLSSPSISTCPFVFTNTFPKSTMQCDDYWQIMGISKPRVHHGVIEVYTNIIWYHCSFNPEHYNAVITVPWCLRSAATRLFIQQIVKANNKEISKVCISVTLWGESPSDKGILRTKDK